jgi:hypothetical protein
MPKGKVQPPEALFNGQPNAGDAHEPENAGDASSDRDELERPAAPAASAGPTRGAPPADANPFSREALRLDQNYGAALGLEQHVHTITVDKPPSEVWFRVHPVADTHPGDPVV